MFHVKLTASIVSLMVLFLSCVGAKQTVQIQDYLLVPNGIENTGDNNLTAFVFENNLRNLPIEQYLMAKFKTDNYLQKEIWITISTDKYKLIIYDNDEFEKYFDSTNYAAVNEEPENAKQGNQRKFIAISIINAYNEDCLAEHSLFQNIAVKYLKNLKDEYYNLR